MILRRRKPVPQTPRADQLRIAVLEHDLLGIQPEPGTPGAVAVALAKPVDRDACPHERVVETTTWGQVRNVGICIRCGAEMVESDAGNWVRP